MAQLSAHVHLNISIHDFGAALGMECNIIQWTAGFSGHIVLPAYHMVQELPKELGGVFGCRPGGFRTGDARRGECPFYRICSIVVKLYIFLRSPLPVSSIWFIPY